MHAPPHCPHCLQPVNPLAHRCGACGTALAHGSTPMAGSRVVGPAPPRSWGRIAFFAAMGGLVLIAITVGIATSGGDEPPGEAAAEVSASPAVDVDDPSLARAVAQSPTAWPRGAERAPDFTYDLTHAVCRRMAYCGPRDDAARSFCQAMQTFVGLRSYKRYDAYGYDTYDRAPPPSCDYASAPASDCLRAIDRLPCDGAPADVPSWLGMAAALPACEGGYRCID